MPLSPLPYLEWEFVNPEVAPEEPDEGEGWGDEEWGGDAWGDGGVSSEDAVVGLDAAYVVANDQLRLDFTVPMKNNALLQATATYEISPFDSNSRPVTVKQVQTGREVGTDTIFLYITEPTIGGIYDITVMASLESLDGDVITQPTQRLIYRKTKTDSLLGTRPEIYELSSDALVRNVLAAIGMEDDRIAGAQSEGEEIFRSDLEE